MNSYNDLNLNQYLQPNNAPVTQDNTILAYTVQSTYERNTVNNQLVQSIGADKIQAGTVIVSINLGSTSSGSLILDGGNNRIIVNDGTTNRIVIGSV